jgi:DNA-binding protein H-NS
MTKATYSQLTAQIAKLQAQADEIREAEKKGVVARIREAIKAYQITPQEVFGASAKTRPSAKSKSKISKAARYSDGAGNEWVGRGPRPQWLRDALAAGKQLQDFAVAATRSNGASGLNGHGKANGAEPAGKRRRAGKAKRRGVVKFSNGPSQTWTGMGPKPKWLKDAIAGGKKLEEFAAR